LRNRNTSRAKGSSNGLFILVVNGLFQPHVHPGRLRGCIRRAYEAASWPGQTYNGYRPLEGRAFLPLANVLQFR
jgi:hypothetical protein